MGERERGQGERLQHRQRLRDQHGAVTIPTVHPDAGKRGKKERGNLAHEAGQAEQECGTGETVHQPAGRQARHPRADQGDALPCEIQPVVSRAKGGERERHSVSIVAEPLRGVQMKRASESWQDSKVASIIDLRSDTCSQPTDAMRDAMARAPVGDDVYGDDPTVKQLEAEVAGVLGVEDAVYVPSGTMSNQIAVRTHTEPGDAVLLDQGAHIYMNEAGGMAALSGTLPRLLPGVRGVFTADDVRATLGVPSRYPLSTNATPMKLLCLENTHNSGGGKIWGLEQIRAVTDVARERGLKTHLDGARLWNA